MNAPYRWFVSARSTVSLLCLLALLLLLNVALPQSAVLGREGYAAVLDESGPLARFFLVTLGFGRMPTSPVFLVTLGLFFLNLVLVLLARLGPTWRRVALKPRSEEGLRKWARLEESISEAVPEGWSAGEAARVLRDFGYQVRRPGKQTLWAVRHRTAPLGFLLFHLSFFMLCAGGMLIYYTRFVGSAVIPEGQSFAGDYGQIERQPPIGGPPRMQFTVGEVDPRMENGEPVHLGATFHFRQSGGAVSRAARVNHPARWGATRVLVHEAGLAPALWMQDERGFTLNRIVVPVRALGRRPTRVELGDGKHVALIHPLGEGDRFPARDALQRTALRYQITADSRVVFDDPLRPGESAVLEGARLVVEENRYCVGIRVIHERGGGVLIAGFTVGILGLIWRLLWYRREVVLDWDDARFRLVGRSEYFSGRFRQELRSVRDVLTRGG